MLEREFNLLHSPWILVMTKDGVTQEVSILDAFRHAHEYCAIAGELPTQDAAVLRLLLAIMHAVFGRVDVDGNQEPLCDGDIDLAFERWESLWNLKQFPMNPIEDYLNKWEDRFWLFHPQTPFYQVPELANGQKVFGPFAVSKLNGDILESDGKPRLFAPRSGKQKESLGYAEAARWLLHVIGYAEDFGMLEAKGKTSKNDPSIGVGWLGKLGLVMAQGHNLFTTLMYNFILLKDGAEVWGSEKPVWERDPSIPVKERNAIPCPDNPSEYLTNLPRQILLMRNEENVVSKYIFLSGSFFPKEASFSEQFTTWRYAKDPGDKQPQFRPKTFDSERQIWRGFETFVVQSEGAKRPGIVEWLKKLNDESIIDSKLITFKTSSPQYGSMSSTITDYAVDSLSFNPNLLTDKGKAWCNRIISEIETTDNLVQQLAFLAQDIAKAAGSDTGNGERDEAKRQAFYHLDSIFRKWLKSIDPQKDEMERKSDDWWIEEQKLIRKLGKELVESAGPKAFVGRNAPQEKAKPMSLIEAYNYFLSKTSSRTALASKGGKND